ncbi:MAG: hypothetical protein LBB49_02305 [Gracilibacteraceae bacterium]|jgi:hypothetical protein|nr:hypothetical protein [Gracilibacteraceae bacterium]
MDKFWKKAAGILSCGWLNIRKWPGNPRIYVIVLLLASFLLSLLVYVRRFCADADIGVTPWLFPFLMDNPYLVFIFMLGILLLFCDAPFVDSHQSSMIIRMGKTTWALGQIFYIMVASALYFATIFVLSNLLMLPHVGFSSGWGQIIGTLAQTNAGGAYGVPFFFSYRIMMDYSPFSAMAWCFCLSWLIGVFLGLVHFVINQSLGRGFGTALALFLIFLPFFAFDMGSGKLFALDVGGIYKNITIDYFSPVSWASLNAIDVANYKPLPPRSYALSALVGINVVLSGLAVLVVRKKSVDIMPPV